MKVKELIEQLRCFEPNADVLVSSDEELNIIFTDFEVAVLGDDDNISPTDAGRVVIYGLSGTEEEDNN